MTFVFLDALNDLLIVFRDPFGKRSLVCHFDEKSGELMLASELMHQSCLSFEIPSNSYLAFGPDDIFYHRYYDASPSKIRFG